MVGFPRPRKRENVMQAMLLLVLGAAAYPQEDAVAALPGFGAPPTPQYSAMFFFYLLVRTDFF